MNKITIVAITILLVSIGFLCGCNEEASDTPPIEGTFEIGIWVYFCWDMTELSTDFWTDYRIINLGEKPVTDVYMSFQLKKPESEGGTFQTFNNETDKLLPNERFSGTYIPYLMVAKDYYYAYARADITISFYHPDSTKKQYEHYEGKCTKIDIWFDETCEVPAYCLTSDECISKYET